MLVGNIVVTSNRVARASNIEKVTFHNLKIERQGQEHIWGRSIPGEGTANGI